MASWKYAAGVVRLILWYMGYSPLRLAWAPFSVARSVIVTVPSALSRSVTGLSTGLAPVDNNSLRSAIRNVTADPDQVSRLVRPATAPVCTHRNSRRVICKVKPERPREATSDVVLQGLQAAGEVFF